MIKIEISGLEEFDAAQLRALGRLMFDLAGEPLTNGNVQTLHIDVTADTSKLQAAIKEAKDAAASDNPFNDTELAESEAIRKENEAAAAERNPDPKTLFGAPSTAGAAPASIAPVGVTATSAVPNASLPPAPPVVPPVTTAAPITAGLASNVDVDSKGLPWDARIHSSSHEKIRDGSWKKRRGVDDALVAQVEAELRGVPSIAPAALPPINPPAIPGHAQGYVAPNSSAGDIPAPVFTPPSVANAQPAAPSAPNATISQPSGSITFPLLMPKITSAVQAGTLTQPRIQEVLAAHGLASIPMLATRADLVPVIDAALFGAA